MAITDNFIIEHLLYEGPSGYRFVQDSPVMPELWKAFARNPKEKQEVLITPHRDVRSGEAAKHLRAAIARWQGGRSDRRERAYNLSGVRLAPLSSQVAVRLDFPLLMGSVMPLTVWWWSLMRKALRSEFGASPETSLRQLEAALIGGPERAELPPGLVWLARLAGLIQLSEQRDVRFPEAFLYFSLAYSERDPREEVREEAQMVSKAFLDLIPEFAFRIPGESQGNIPRPSYAVCIHRITRNRRVELAVNNSAAAIKADAARRVFDISCQSITWEIIDSGIDVHHDAFIDHTCGGCRIDAVYDFTILRELNDLYAVEAALRGGRADPLFSELLRRQADQQDDEEAMRILRAHRERLEEGDDVDYNLIEPFLRDLNPIRPALAHGTHVAGILGADWRENGASKMTGVCPDIRLIDMRVMRPDGNSAEFEVISALAFLRSYNNRSGRLAIHGANLSLSIDHDLRGGDACGRTPVCVECDRTVSSGVCIAAAAGNRGSVHVPHFLNNAWHGMDIYLNASITDPGNADSVITVGSTHRNRPHEYGVSFFSSRGPTGDGRTKPDIVAPGERIMGPAPGQDMYESDGTSLAVPHISGAAALIMSRHAELIGQPGQIKTILCETATDLRREAYFQGSGLVDVLRALQSV